MILGFIRNRMFCKKSDEREGVDIIKSKMRDENHISGGNVITGKKNQNIQTDSSNEIFMYGNVNNITNSYNIYTNNDNKDKNNSWFSERFEVLLSLLNEARSFNEKEYTVEYVSSLIGLKNVEGLKIYLTQDKEPDDEFKRKFIKAFGVNEEWIVHGRGDYPFASNISFWGKDPMDILRKSDLKNIKKFIVVIGNIRQRRHACIIRQKKALCYELYPKYFTLNSNVGGTGMKNLVEFYRFLRETRKLKKLDNNTYYATEEQMNQLMCGKIFPKKVENFELARYFIDDFMCISEAEIEENKKGWDEDFISVQQIIAANIEEYDRIYQEGDLKLIEENLGENLQKVL